MSDLISREQAIEEIKSVFEWHDVVTVDRLVEHIKALQSQQKTGKWIDDNGNRTQQYRNNFKCSECGHYQHTPVAKRVYEFEQENKFCHWCGSLMRGEEE